MVTLLTGKVGDLVTKRLSPVSAGYLVVWSLVASLALPVSAVVLLLWGFFVDWVEVDFADFFGDFGRFRFFIDGFGGFAFGWLGGFGLFFGWVLTVDADFSFSSGWVGGFYLGRALWDVVVVCVILVAGGRVLLFLYG